MSDNRELMKDFEQGWHSFNTYQLNIYPIPETLASPGDFFSEKTQSDSYLHGAFIQVGKDRKYMGKKRGKTCNMKIYVRKRNVRDRDRKGKVYRFRF